VFDSGIGGLTVVKALNKLLPHERIVYYGDTAHLPYGDKSPDTLQGYVRHIARFLVETGAKAVVVACNTASAVAFAVAEAECRAAGVPVFEVITPAVEAAVHSTTHERIGIIGTQTTVHAHVYLQRILQRLPRAYVVEKATPLLVPLIEEGWLNHPLCGQVIDAYMSDTAFQHIDTLILGCTHYPLIQQQVEAFFAAHHRTPVQVVSSSATTAQHVATQLTALNLLNPGPKPLPDRFYVTDHTASFQRMAEQFFAPGIQLVKLKPGGD
jgi:glutamate racemase